MLLPVDEALRRVLAGAGRMPAETVPLRKADSRVLHEPLIAARDQPPFDASAMDGYAARAADASIGATLAVVGQSIAGRRFAGEVTPGTAVRIFTGAPVPSGADTILIQENAIAAGANVTVNEAPALGRFIRPRALDFAAGATLLEAGRRLGVRELALAAAAGASILAV
ncbi:MAG: molybdopterin molybdenumtransferase MoeA, partial [Bauldia sp.]